MKPKILLLILATVVVTASATWFIARRVPERKAEVPGNRQVLYYQSAMHPWIKSDKPGKCTVCGMDLVAVYEGDHGFDMAGGMVTLSSNSINVLNVQTAEVKRRPLVRSLRVAGTIESDDTRQRILSAYIDGRIEKLYVNYVGAEVREGEPLATFYSPMLLTAEREFLALTKQATAVGVNAPAQEHERMIAAAAQRLKLLGLTEKQIVALRQQGDVSNRTEILAPISGTVVARSVYEGQYVKEGDRLFELADFSTMWFQFDAYERDLAWLRVGQAVEVTTPSMPERVFAAKISFIDPNINDTTRSAKVRVEIPNPLIESNAVTRRDLLRRLYAEGVAHVDTPEVLTTPRSAVLSSGKNPLAYVDKGSGAYEQRKVKLGRVGDEYWEVLDGLSDGERVVTTGNLLIDAQAQLAESAHGEGGHGESTPAALLPALNIEQQKVVQEVLSVASALAAALAADNFSAFNQHAPKLHTLAPALSKTFAESPDWAAFIGKIESTAHLPTAANLAEARKSFLPFSMATVELAKRLRAQETGFRSWKIYVCPMVNTGIPGASKDGYWIQAESPLRNPYFGSQMIDCGREVTP